jgi:hypothetical protein
MALNISGELERDKNVKYYSIKWIITKSF